MGELGNSRSDGGDDDTRQIVINVVGGLITTAVLAAGGLALGFSDEIWFWVALAAVSTAAAVVLGIVALRRSRALDAALRAPRPRVKEYETRGGSVLMGVDVGRFQMSLGVLEMRSDADRTRLPRVRDYTVLKSDQQRSPLSPAYDPAQMPSRYDVLARGIAEMLNGCGKGVDGIGLGLPGQVTPGTGIVDSPKGFGSNAMVAWNVAARLATDAGARLALGVTEPNASQERLTALVESKLLLDNDVRCATRALLSEGPKALPASDFACVFVGTGVGAGIVLGGSIFYGATFTAGEVGHMTLHLSSEQYGNVAREFALGHAPPGCGCEREGVHWESLVGGAGLMELARQHDPDRAQELGEFFSVGDRPGLVTPPQLAATGQLLAGSNADERTRKALAHEMQDARGEQISTDQVDAAIEKARIGFRKDPGLAEYVNGVLLHHAGYLAIGAANLANVANLGGLAMGGGIIDGLWPLAAYRAEYARVVGKFALPRPASVASVQAPYHAEGLRPGWAWRGSALLSWDPSYQRIVGAQRD